MKVKGFFKNYLKYFCLIEKCQAFYLNIITLLSQKLRYSMNRISLLLEKENAISYPEPNCKFNVDVPFYRPAWIVHNVGRLRPSKAEIFNGSLRVYAIGSTLCVG